MSDNLVDRKSQCCHAVFLRVGWAEKLYPKITVSSACIKRLIIPPKKITLTLMVFLTRVVILPARLVFFVAAKY